MAETTLNNDLSAIPVSSRLNAWLRPLITFLLITLAIVIIWQLAKDVFDLNQRKLPDLASIIQSYQVPIQEGKPTLGAMLLSASIFTLREAVLGFVVGALLGFLLAILFAHSRLLERGFMPYVVASQTVPILAIAPMVVIWLKAGWLSVTVISAYLTFFPVTINTLRGLQSVAPTAVELMDSYAASRWQILTKLRIPNALPYIFTALKVSATSSIVGAIIGELPSGLQDGLGYQILNYSQYYLQGPERLWATVFVAALLGILAFLLVSAAEKLIVRWSPPEANS
ncbi:MAG: ABC transporter permease [Anaerolineae bacterium]|nr:ABC transporter permease [Anaerolineae bacterium]